MSDAPDPKLAWSDLTREIMIHGTVRDIRWPSTLEALSWFNTELGEAMELYMAKPIEGRQWVRNHPEDKEPWSKERFAEELGDAIMMLVMMGLAEDVDPLWALHQKLQRKIREAISQPKFGCFFTTMPVDPES